MTEIQKYKSEEEMTMDELTECVSARRNDKPVPKFETDAYKQARREALEDAGLEPDDDSSGELVALDEQSVDEHLKRVQANR